jgi:hypothetical protein
VLPGTEQIKDAGNYFQVHQTDFNIALLHHPLSDMSEHEQGEVEMLFNNYHFGLLMCGH